MTQRFTAIIEHDDGFYEVLCPQLDQVLAIYAAQRRRHYRDDREIPSARQERQYFDDCRASREYVEGKNLPVLAALNGKWSAPGPI